MPINFMPCRRSSKEFDASQIISCLAEDPTRSSTLHKYLLLHVVQSLFIRLSLNNLQMCENNYSFNEFKRYSVNYLIFKILSIVRNLQLEFIRMWYLVSERHVKSTPTLFPLKNGRLNCMLTGFALYTPWYNISREIKLTKPVIHRLPTRQNRLLMIILIFLKLLEILGNLNKITWRICELLTSAESTNFVWINWKSLWMKVDKI